MRGTLQRFALACLPMMVALSLFAGTTNAPAPAAPADTNFMDPNITDDSASAKMLNDVLKKNGVKTDSLLDEHFLFASVIWGGVAGGYLFYARKQREIMPLIGGIAMMAVSFMIASWFWMSLASIGIMVAVYSLMKRGY
jgi:hypothetical protein